MDIVELIAKRLKITKQWNKTKKEVRFKEDDKVRIISKNIEGVIVSTDSINMIYENCIYRVRVGKYTTLVAVSDLEKLI